MKNLLYFYAAEFVVLLPVLIIFFLIYMVETRVITVKSGEGSLFLLFFLARYALLIIPIVIWSHMGILNLYEQWNGCSF